MMGAVYALADAALALASFWIAYLIRANLPGVRPLYPVIFYIWIVPLVILLWLGVGWAGGAYRDVQNMDLRRALLDPLKTAVFAGLVFFAAISLAKVEFISRSLVAFYAAADFGLMILFRLVARQGRLASSMFGVRTFLLVGGTGEAIEIAKSIEASESHGMRVAGFALAGFPSDEAELKSAGLRRAYPVYSLHELPELLRSHVIDEVIFVVSKSELVSMEETFLICEQEGVTTRLSLDFLPHTIAKASFDRLGGTPLLTFSSTPDAEYFMLLKRLADFVMAAFVMAAVSPLFLTLAALIKLTSRGPVFFRQTRCGLGGRRFTLYKFRSMRLGADLRREELRDLNELDGPVFKIRNDPRCTGIGRWMRRLSLDELPQMLNILKGDMSFVGPRPPLPAEVEHYERWQRRRLRMQPGLTCLWALEGRSRLNFKRWMELDLEYIDHWSPMLDWKILLKTIPVVLLGRGAF